MPTSSKITVILPSEICNGLCDFILANESAALNIIGSHFIIFIIIDHVFGKGQS